jgi:hypothetical protein
MVFGPVPSGVTIRGASGLRFGPQKAFTVSAKKKEWGGCDAVSMFNAQDFIGNTRNAIKNDRRKAFWYKVAGYAVGLFGYAVFITGAIQGLALAPPQFRSGPLFGIFATLGYRRGIG